MKIYGRPLSSVIALLPLPLKIVVFAGAAFVLFTLVYIPASLMASSAAEQAPAPLLLNTKNDILSKLDPSIATDGKSTLMVFTALKTPPEESAEKDFVTAVMAVSAYKGCTDFGSAEQIFETKTEELMGPDGATPVTTGSWRVETPSVIHDPADTARPWKIFAYKYFWAGKTPLARLYSVIVMKTAEKPEGPWSNEEWIFSSSDTRPPYPYGAAVQTKLSSLSPDLADVYFYARPSALQVNNVILMTLSAFRSGMDTPEKIILLASVDHGKSWKYLGTPLAATDITRVDPALKTIAGASLIDYQGTIYLAMTPGDEKVSALGTYMIPFADVLKAKLKADPASGRLLTAKKIPRLSVAPTEVGGGFATYAAGCKTGIITSEFSGLTGRYELFMSRHAPGDGR